MNNYSFGPSLTRKFPISPRPIARPFPKPAPFFNPSAVKIAFLALAIFSLFYIAYHALKRKIEAKPFAGQESREIGETFRSELMTETTYREDDIPVAVAEPFNRLLTEEEFLELYNDQNNVDVYFVSGAPYNPPFPPSAPPLEDIESS